ncbi:ERVV1 protein, partial [Himantopus himantopus]|nr:ERVV1 protein [Himantopus himantopus]
SELEKALVNISAAIEILGNNAADAITALQEEISQLSKITLQNRMALDTLLASQGGVCL